MGTRNPLHIARLAARYAFLQRSQWWTESRIRTLQLARLRKLLISAFEHTAYYRTSMEQRGFDPVRDCRSLSDLERLPILDKRSLLAAPLSHRLRRGADPASLVHRHTSGSTAEPFEIYLSQYEKDARVLLELRMLRAHGIGPKGRMLELRRNADLETGSGTASMLGLFPRRGISFLMSSSEKLEALHSFCPQVFKAHPSSLVPMAELLVRSGANPSSGLRCILSSAEYLDASSRRVIEQAFGVPVFDQYGCVEFGFLAWECPTKNGLHVSAEDFIVELVNESGERCAPGQSGEVVITALQQHTMPLIRYRTGDRAMWLDEGPCSCGRSLPRLRLRRGRTVDYFARADGSEVNPHFFTVLWEGIEGVRQFQVIQESLDELTWRYVPEVGSDCSGVESKLRERIGEEFGPATRVSFERVPVIPPEVSGKLKYLHSKIKRPATVAED